MFLYVTSQHVYKVDIKHCYLLEKEWQEGSVTWNSPWQSAGGAYSEPPVFTNTNTVKNTWEEFDVTDAVMGMINGTKPNYGFIVTFPSTNDRSRAAYYRSSEYGGDKSLRPKMVIYTGATGTENEVGNTVKSITCKTVNGGIHIRFAGSLNEKVTLVTLSGREVISFTTDGRKTWYPLSESVSPGVHVIRVEGHGRNMAGKVHFVK